MVIIIINRYGSTVKLVILIWQPEVLKKALHIYNTHKVR